MYNYLLDLLNIPKSPCLIIAWHNQEYVSCNQYLQLTHFRVSLKYAQDPLFHYFAVFWSTWLRNT